MQQDTYREILLNNHPSELTGLCEVNNEARSLCSNINFLAQLTKKWLFPQHSDSEVYQIAKNITIEEIAAHSLFFSPTPGSMGKFHPISLYNQASLRGYSEVNCETYLQEFFENLRTANYTELIAVGFIAIESQHLGMLNKLSDKLSIRHSTRSGMLGVTLEIRRLLCWKFIVILLNDDEGYNVASEEFSKFRYPELMIEQINEFMGGLCKSHMELSTDAIPMRVCMIIIRMLSDLHLINDDDEEVESLVIKFTRSLATNEGINFALWNLASLTKELSKLLTKEQIEEIVAPFNNEGWIVNQNVVNQIDEEEEGEELGIFNQYWNLKLISSSNIFTYRPNDYNLGWGFNMLDCIVSDNYYHYLKNKHLISNGNHANATYNSYGYVGYNPLLLSKTNIEKVTPELYVDYAEDMWNSTADEILGLIEEYRRGKLVQISGVSKNILLPPKIQYDEDNSTVTFSDGDQRLIMNDQ